MRITTLLILTTLLHAHAASYGQLVTISVKKMPMTKVFESIEKKTGYHFFYPDDLLLESKTISITVTNGTLEKTLDLCLQDQPLIYKIINRSIVISRREALTKPPGIRIQGLVTTEQAEPIAGISVIIRGSSIGTMTDESGGFTLSSVDPQATLIFSGSSVETREIPVRGNQWIAVRLKAKINRLDQVQVIAYGTISRKLNTGDVSSVKAEAIAEQPITNPLSAIQGRAPGIYITQESGVPGTNFTVQIRGQNSIAGGNNPLYVIDGVPFSSVPLGSDFSNGSIGNGSPLNLINPAEIESIEILKDADATSIYGSRGSNGVILITTKKGKSGKTTLNLNLRNGFSQVAHYMSLLNTPEYITMRKEAFKNDNASPQSYDYDLTAWDPARNTKWQKLFFGGNARFSEGQLALSGGSATTQFNMGGSYHKETTVFPGDFSFSKISAHLNVAHQSANKKFSLNMTANYTSDNNTLPYVTLVFNALQTAPNAPSVFDSTGHLNWANGFNNPYNQFLRQINIKSANLISSALASYAILRGLDLKASIGYNRIDAHELSQLPLSSYNPAIGLLSGRSFFATNEVDSWIAEPQLSYRKKWGEGTLQLLVGGTLQQSISNGQTLIASGFSSDLLLTNLAAASNVSVENANYAQYRYAAFFGRINFNWKDKYLINLTARRDGSSRFGPGRQFADFGAVGAAWIFSSSDWLKDKVPVLSFGKLRASYGTSGNDQIGDYQYLETWSPTIYPYQSQSGLAPNRLYNPGYGWELNRKWEAALDFGFFKNRILLSAAWYLNRSSNQLVGYPLPGITGFAFIQSNAAATVQNTGLELELSTTNIKTRDWKWTSEFNISFPKNRLISYPNLAASAYANQYTIGQSLFSRKTFASLGVNQQTGVYQFEQANTQTPTSNPVYPDDLLAIKTLQQQYYGGLLNSVSIKNWQLDFLFQFVKQTRYNYLANFNTAPGTFSNQPSEVMGRWQKPGDQSSIQQFTQDPNSVAYNAFINQAFYGNYISDGSFIRLKNVSLSYQFNTARLEKAGIQSARIFAQGQNLWTVTHYIGLDPEVSDPTRLPPLRTVVFGLQFIF